MGLADEESGRCGTGEDEYWRRRREKEEGEKVEHSSRNRFLLYLAHWHQGSRERGHERPEVREWVCEQER